MMDNEVIGKFIDEFSDLHIRGTEIRISSAEVREFLRRHDLSMTFNAFNKITGCLGRTTSNRYAYSIPVLLSGGKTGSIQREFTSSRIKTLSWYGSKRAWMQEWEAILGIAAREHGCTKVVDAFGGSGFLSLLAARTGLYDEIVLNDSSSMVYNFHAVMQGEQTFEKFISRLEALGEVSKETFKLLYANLYGTSGIIAGLEKRKQVRTLSVMQAVELFVTRHYGYDGQGAYVANRKEPAAYIESLRRTHGLYRGMELKNLHYKKLVREVLDDNTTLLILDPPYIRSTRVQKRSYGKEFTTRQHQYLLQLLTKETIAAKVILCGYESALYSSYFKGAEGWHCIQFRGIGKKGVQEENRECVWLNFDLPIA